MFGSGSTCSNLVITQGLLGWLAGWLSGDIVIVLWDLRGSAGEQLACEKLIEPLDRRTGRMEGRMEDVGLAKRECRLGVWKGIM